MSGSTDWRVLYHYTSLKSFERIIKSGYISLNDIIKSNDPAEGFFAFDALKEAYKSLYHDDRIDKETYDKLHRAYFDFSGNETAFGRFQHTILSISFCKPELPLALWRCYGDNGKGIAFSISKNRLMELGKKDNFRFSKIEYLTQDEMVDMAKEFWLENHEKSEEELFKQLGDFYIRGYFVKRKENEYEREWRLVYTGINLEEYCLIPRSVPDEVDVFMREDDMVAFYKIPIRPDRLIEHIYIGPQCKITYNEMKLFLSKYEVKHNGVLSDGIVMR